MTMSRPTLTRAAPSAFAIVALVHGVATLLAPATARGKARLRVLIAGSVAGSTPATKPVQAKRGQRVILYAVVARRRGRRSVYFTDAPALRVGRRRVRGRRLRPLRRLGDVALRWSRIEPQPHHVSTPPPNRKNPAYSNARLFGPHHGRWIGYDRIEYAESPIAGAKQSRLELARVAPSHPRVDVHGGLGTMRYRVRVRIGDVEISSPGAPPTVVRGISPRVMRVSFRSGDGFVGFLTSFYNVPNVFGSGGGTGRSHQTELYQGADCADVLIGAARRAGAPLRYTSVLGLERYAAPITPLLLLSDKGVFYVDDQRKPERSAGLSFAQDVAVGDLMLIDYVGFDGSPRSWDHVAVISGDAGRRGWFDPEDLVMHMGYLYGLTEAPARTEGPAIIRLLRFKPRVRRAWRRARRRRLHRRQRHK